MPLYHVGENVAAKENMSMKPSAATLNATHKLRRDAESDGVSKAFLRRVIRRDIDSYCQRRLQTHDRARIAANRLLKLDSHNETVMHVADSCDRISKLLEQLQSETKIDDVADAPDIVAAKADDNPEELDEVQALRVFASDDTTLETSSVADYAADPPGAPLFSETCVPDCMDGVKTSSHKALGSVATLRHLITENAQWWNSAIVIRRLKTHAIRANYHMRKVRKWGDQCRSHLFVSNSILSKTALEATKELQEMKQQTETIRIRRKTCEEKKKNIEATSQTLVAQVAALTAESAALDDQLRQRVVDALGAHVADAQVCETILLLHTILPAHDIRQIASSVQAFLSASNMTLPQAAS